MERKRALICDDGASTSSVPPKCWRESQEALGEMLDGNAACTEKYEDLHSAIQAGDLESVKCIVEGHAEEQHFSFDETSALYRAFECKRLEIISYLIYKGAKFVGSENDCVYSYDIDLDRLNHLLFHYNQRSEKSCVYRLMSLSQSPQVLDGERLNALMSMYEFLFQSDIIKSLIKVLETVDFDIVFDFKSDKVNQVHRLSNEEEEIFGLTLSTVREIFIGAQNLLSSDIKKRAKVYGVVAEELCHLALTTVFNNNAKPYKEEDSDLIQEFQGIVLAVKSLIPRSCHVESVIQEVFKNYKAYSWECELIARVPHVIGIYGEESGRRIFQESSELKRLLTFYENKVLPKCREYTTSNTKSDRIMKQLTGKAEFITFKEKQIRPLKEEFPSFRKYVVVEKGVSVMSTNCIKLSALHIYHQLKLEYGDQLDRKCLFFGSECFKKKRDVVLKALKIKLCDYLVLILDDEELYQRTLLCEYLDEFKEFENEGINIIIISNSQLLDPKFHEKASEYNWDNLTDEYKDFRTSPVEYIFKGARKEVYIKKEIVPQLFIEEDIIKIISGDVVEVRDGKDLNCQGYNPETYVERQFQAKIIDRKLFGELPDDTAILICGLQRWDCGELSTNKSRVQWLEGPDDEIQKGKAIFVSNKERPMKFKDFVRKTTVKNRICLKYDRKMFYLMNSEGHVFKQHKKEIRQTEEEIIDLLKSNKSLIVSENAGCGKSTVISSLIWRMKKMYDSWVSMVDLNKFSMKDEGPDCEENDEEELFEDIFLMLGLTNGFEKCRFRNRSDQEECFIFFDAFDEIPSEYKTKALELISFLRKKTDAKIMITTRMHHQQELEEVLNMFSLQLVPFDNQSQVYCLGKLWKWKLKFPNGEGAMTSMEDKRRISRKIKSIVEELEKEKTDSESHCLILALKKMNLEDSVDSIRSKIDGLELNGLADSVLKKTSMDKDRVEFMGMPLHLYMVGVIYFDSNFNVDVSSGIHGIYSKFVEQKILISVEEKQGISYCGRAKKSIIKKETEDAYRIHMDLANQLMESGRIDIKMSDGDSELCRALGIVVIKGAEVDFLHHTFLEFFRAESIRRNLIKKNFTDVLFVDKYYIVLRFLESSFASNGFENLNKEFFKDLDFLFVVLTHFNDYVDGFKKFYIHYTLELHLSLASKIVKCLLEKFEGTVESEILDEFVRKFETVSLSYENWFMIGGCIPVKILKMLLNQNLKVYSKMIIGVVKYYSNPGEAIDLLNECISIPVECDTNEGEIEKKAERLFWLFRIKDSKGRSLFKSAIFNERKELFAKILEFSMEILGKEHFIDGVIKSEEYRDAIYELMDNADISDVIRLFGALNSVFGDEFGILFDKKVKFGILRENLRCETGFRIDFGEIIDLFKEYFGIENLKEILLSGDSDGEHLISYLPVGEERSATAILDIVKNTLDDKSKMRQFLMFNVRALKNLFHFSVEVENIDFGDFLQFCNTFLEKEDIKEMLISCDNGDWNVLHFLFKSYESERIIENLILVKNYLADEELEELLKSKDEYLRNIFHCAAMNGREINTSILNSCLDTIELKELLIERDKYGQTFLHCGANWNSKNLLILLNYSFEILKDYEGLFEEIILAENKDGNTFLHRFVEEYYIGFREEFVIELIESVKEKVSDDIFIKLLRARNKKGETCLQIKDYTEGLISLWRSEVVKNRIIECLKGMLEKNLFVELLQKNENV